MCSGLGEEDRKQEVLTFMRRESFVFRPVFLPAYHFVILWTNRSSNEAAFVLHCFLCDKLAGDGGWVSFVMILTD